MAGLHQGNTYDHCMSAVKGWFNDGNRDLDFAAKADASNTQNLVAGRIVHYTAAGGFALGATGSKMPMILFSSYTDTDVNNSGVNPNNNQQDWRAIEPRGYYSALVATGGFEVETTEFNTGDEFLPNTPLHAPTEAQIGVNVDTPKAGMLFARRSWSGGGNAAIAAYTDNICGIVSRGVGKYSRDSSTDAPNTNNWLRSYPVSTLMFWTYFLPGNAANV